MTDTDSAASIASLIAGRPEFERVLEGLSPEAQQALFYQWAVWARPSQLPPEHNPRTRDGSWRTWLLQAGRGFGKTLSGAQWVRGRVEAGRARSIALIGATKESTRKIMIEGPSGLLSGLVSPPWCFPTYEASLQRVQWPNGAVAYAFSSEVPDLIRGYNFDLAWLDEFAAFENMEAVYANLAMALRIPGPLGDNPQECISSTPRPLPLLRRIAANPLTVVTRGATYENAANLAPQALQTLRGEHEGTRLGRQELMGELLDDAEGVLWREETINASRRAPPEWRLDRDRFGSSMLRGPKGEHVAFERIVVAIDPAGTAHRRSNETGIVVAAHGEDGDGYVLADLSGIHQPDRWALIAADLFREWQADRIVAEANFGHAMVESTLRAVAPSLPVRLVHASRGKIARAEPIAALYEQGRVHHVGNFPRLEDQLVSYDPLARRDSPDRMDALVWALSELMLKRTVERRPYTAPKVIALFQR